MPRNLGEGGPGESEDRPSVTSSCNWPLGYDVASAGKGKCRGVGG